MSCLVLVMATGSRAEAFTGAFKSIPLPRANRGKLNRPKNQTTDRKFGWQRNSEMAAFWKTVDRHASRQPLSGYKVFAVQHVLDSTGELLRALAESGAEPADITVLGKSYSEDGGVIEDLKRQGFNIIASQQSLRTDVSRQVQALINEAKANPLAKFLIVDDGGEFITQLDLLLKDPDVPADLATRVVAVEQTMRGPIKVDKLNKTRRLAGTADRMVRLANELAAPQLEQMMRDNPQLAEQVKRLDRMASADPAFRDELVARIQQNSAALQKFRQMVAEMKNDPNTPEDIVRLLNQAEEVERKDPGHAKKIGQDLVALRKNQSLWARLIQKRDAPISIPVVSVAQSKGKKKYESPMIGRSVAQVSHRELQKLTQQGILPFDPQKAPVRVLLMGFGNVSSATAKEMQNLGYDVATCDPLLAQDLKKQRRAQNLKVTAFDDKAEAFKFRPQVIISATGQVPFTPEDANALENGVVFINAASSKTEFPMAWHNANGYLVVGKQKKNGDIRLHRSRDVSTVFMGKLLPVGKVALNQDPRRQKKKVGQELRRAASYETLLMHDLAQPLLANNPGGWLSRWLQAPYIWADVRAPRVIIDAPSGKEFLLLNGGHPINFGGRDPIPAQYIQVTRGLLYLACIQAVEAKAPGFHPVHARPQRLLIRDIQQQLREAKMGPLRAPTF